MPSVNSPLPTSPTSPRPYQPSAVWAKACYSRTSIKTFVTKYLQFLWRRHASPLPPVPKFASASSDRPRCPRRFCGCRSRRQLFTLTSSASLTKPYLPPPLPRRRRPNHTPPSTVDFKRAAPQLYRASPLPPAIHTTPDPDTSPASNQIRQNTIPTAIFTYGYGLSISRYD